MNCGIHLMGKGEAQLDEAVCGYGPMPQELFSLRIFSLPRSTAAQEFSPNYQNQLAGLAMVGLLCSCWLKQLNFRN